MSSTAHLVVKARLLRNASPRAFDEFTETFRAYTASASEILLAATENWQLYQGHAQQCRKILNTLEEAQNG